MRKIIVCKGCEQKKEHRAFGLCGACVAKRWYANNLERQKKLHREWIIKNWETEKKKQNIRNKDSKLRQPVCLLCSNKEKLVFHHTDYEFRMGCTLCQSCHRKQHSGGVSNSV